MSSASITSINNNFTVAKAPVVLCMCWSYDGSVLAIGTSTGYIVYSFEGPGGGHCEPSRNDSGGDQPLRELCRRYISIGVMHISIFGQYNLVMFVGATEESQNIVYLWDDMKYTATAADAEVVKEAANVSSSTSYNTDVSIENHRCVIAKLVMDAPVRAIRLHKFCILVADDNFVHMFDENLCKQGTFSGPCEKTSEPENNSNTIDIARSPAVVRGSYECSVLRFICLGPKVGSLWCVRYMLSVRSNKWGLVEDADRYREKNLISKSIISVHNSGIKTMKLCGDGSRAVTVSCKGTAFKLVDIVREEVICQFSRGTTPNNVPCISISEDCSFFVSLSESGTLHTFFIQGGPSECSQNLGMVQLPDWLKNNYFIKDSVAYAQSHKSIVSYSLLDTEQDYEVSGDDVFIDNALENLGLSNVGRSSFIPVSAAYSCIAIRPEAHAGMAALFACIGGTTVGAKARCLRVELNLREGTARRAATHIFPREEF